MTTVFCKQGELKILFLQFKKSGISNREKKKKTLPLLPLLKKNLCDLMVKSDFGFNIH